MNEPIGTTAATLTATGTALAAPLLGIDPGIAIGAVCGAGIFVMNEGTESHWKRLFLFLVSVALGCLGATSFAAIMSWFIPASVQVSAGVGAVIASAVSVRIVQQLIRLAETTDFAQLFRGKRG